MYNSLYINMYISDLTITWKLLAMYLRDAEFKKKL